LSIPVSSRPLRTQPATQCRASAAQSSLALGCSCAEATQPALAELLHNLLRQRSPTTRRTWWSFWSRL